MRTYLICMRTTYKGDKMKTPSPSSVRFPDEIVIILRNLAKSNDRSYSKEILSRVKRTLKQDGLLSECDA
ncbi:Arc family DNA-binding protein [Morganella morganii]|uniref:Arc family DNA-binding protein n=2 Tax=Morganella morganii TaxID=582 RepID=UPI0032AE8E11